MSPDHKAAYFWGGYVAQGGIPWRFFESSLLSRSVSHETFFLGEIFADSDATWATIVARFQGQTIKKTQTFPKHFPTFVIYTKSPKDRRNWGVGISSIWFGPVIFFYPVLQFFVCCLRFPSEFADCVGICLCGTSKKIRCFALQKKMVNLYHSRGCSIKCWAVVHLWKWKKCKKDVVRVRVFWIPYEVLLNNKKAKILRGCLYRRFLFKFIG